VTQVTRKISRAVILCVALLAARAEAQSPAPVSEPTKIQAPDPNRPAEKLYLQLQNVGLDPARTFHIRGVSIDRPALHILLDDGEIAFTADVAGRVTGALFEGDGELLLTPPNQGERASMMLFTGMAILEERFDSAYLRFNDDTFAELQPYLRPATRGPEFVEHVSETARNLADQDAQRLLGTFARALPAPGVADPTFHWVSDPSDRMLHARVKGNKLGTFDAYFDTKGVEEVWAGQSRTVDGQTFYDLWTSFTPQTGATSRSDRTSIRLSDDVAISRFNIRAQVTPPTTLAAEASVKMEVHRGGERTVYFELSRFLQVKQVEVDGRAVEYINNPSIDGSQLSRRGNDLVAVIFPEPLRKGQIVNLRFVYSGDVLSEAGGGLLYVGARGTWYPNRGLAMADFDLEFRYPPGWTLVATGKRISGSERGTSVDSSDSEEQSSHWVTERPSILAGFNLGRYEMASAMTGDVTVKAYAARAMEKAFPRPSAPVVSPPSSRNPRMNVDPILHQAVVPSPARNAQAVADSGARAVDFYSKRFGSYPYSSLELTQMPGRMSQGWPGLVFLSSFAFLTHDQAEDLSGSPLESALTGLTLPHEIGHQWWGDLVGWRSYRDQWIVEALSNYSALMMLEQDRPADVRAILEQYREELAQKNKNDEALRDAGPVTLGLRLSSSHFPNGYEAISYGRGTWLFHMLRNMLLNTEPAHASKTERAPFDPDEPFVRALRKVRERYAGKFISTRELFSVFEEELPKPLWYEGHKSLDWFVRSWVEGTSLPVFNLHNVKYEKKANSTEVTGTIQQKETPQDYVSAIPVYAVIADKKILIGTVLTDGPETAFRLAAPAGTRKVLLDPYQTLLSAPRNP
jgi:hypothetical protein